MGWPCCRSAPVLPASLPSQAPATPGHAQCTAASRVINQADRNGGSVLLPSTILFTLLITLPAAEVQSAAPEAARGRGTRARSCGTPPKSLLCVGTLQAASR